MFGNFLVSDYNDGGATLFCVYVFGECESVNFSKFILRIWLVSGMVWLLWFQLISDR